MPKYVVRFETVAEVTVEIEAPDEDVAADSAYEQAFALTRQYMTDHRGAVISLSIDGIGGDVEEVS